MNDKAQDPAPPAAASDAAIAQAFREGKARQSSSQIGHEQWIEKRAIEIQSAQPSGVAVNEASFAELAMLYMTRHEVLHLTWGDMAALFQQDGTPTLAPPIAQQGGGEELWKFVERAYDAAKTSRSERLLDDLGLPVSDVEMPLSWHINRAALAGKAEGGVGAEEVGSIADDVMFGWRLAASNVCERDARRSAEGYARKKVAP